MKRLIGAVGMLMMFMVCSLVGYAQEIELKDGGPKYIYVKPLKKSPLHMPYDEEMKCIACHQWDGTDAYTSATLSLTKSKTGRLPKQEIKQAILDTVKGLGITGKCMCWQLRLIISRLRPVWSIRLIRKVLFSMPHQKNREKSFFIWQQTKMYLWYMLNTEMTLII